MRWFFALIALCAFFTSADAAQTAIRIARSDSVQVDNDTTWYSGIYNVDTSKPVQLVVVVSTWTAGAITISLQGLVKTANGADSTWAGASTEALVTCAQRGSIGAAGRYYIQASPGVSVLSSTGGGVLPFIRAAVSTDNTAVCIFDAYLIYHIPDQTFGPEGVTP